MNQLAKIRRHRWKKRLKTSKFAGFESDLLTTSTIKLHEVAKFYRSLYSGGGGGGGGKPCKTSRLCERKCITFKLSKFLFSAVSTDFCHMILIKSWGKPWINITRSSTLSSVQNNWGIPFELVIHYKFEKKVFRFSFLVQEFTPLFLERKLK